MVRKIRTTSKRRSNLPACIGKPFPPQSGENPGLLESSSGGSGNSSSNPSSIAPEKEVHLNRERNPSRGQNFGLQFLDHRRAEDTPMILSSSSTYDSTPWWIQEEGCTHTLLTKRFLVCVIRIDGGSHTPSLEKKIEKEFMYEDWLHRLHRRRFKTKLEICKNADKEFSDIRAIRRHSAEIIIPSRMTNYVMFHHKRRWHTRKSVSHKEKMTHKKGVHILSK